jgi:hypothetical protein
MIQGKQRTQTQARAFEHTTTFDSPIRLKFKSANLSYCLSSVIVRKKERMRREKPQHHTDSYGRSNNLQAKQKM